MRAGQSDMNKLTKQWFDDVNRDVNDAVHNEADANGGAKVFYKKPAHLANGKLKPNKYAGSNTSGSSKVLLESTDEDDDDDDNDEQIVIDKTLLLRK